MNSQVPQPSQEGAKKREICVTRHFDILFLLDWRLFLIFCFVFTKMSVPVGHALILFFFLFLFNIVVTRRKWRRAAWGIPDQRSCHFSPGIGAARSNRTGPAIPRHPRAVTPHGRQPWQPFRKSFLLILFIYLFIYCIFPIQFLPITIFDLFTTCLMELA